jgi:hypothetical protein
MDVQILFEARPETGARYLYIGRVTERNNYCEIRVFSSENIVELYLNGELRHKQKSSGEFVFCTSLGDYSDVDTLDIVAKTVGEEQLSDEVTVKIR